VAPLFLLPVSKGVRYGPPMNDQIEIPLEDEPEKPRVIVLITGHEPLPQSLSRQLRLLAATQMIVLAGRREIEEQDVPSLDDLTTLILERHIRDIPPAVLAMSLREIRQDYNAHAAQAPRKQDHGMMAKAHDATGRMAAKSARFRHFH